MELFSKLKTFNQFYEKDSFAKKKCLYSKAFFFMNKINRWIKEKTGMKHKTEYLLLEIYS